MAFGRTKQVVEWMRGAGKHVLPADTDSRRGMTPGQKASDWLSGVIWLVGLGIYLPLAVIADIINPRE